MDGDEAKSAAKGHPWTEDDGVALVPQVKTHCAGIRSSYGVSVKMNVKVAGQPLSTAVLLGRGFT